MSAESVVTIPLFLFTIMILLVNGGYDCTLHQPNRDCYILCNGNEGCDDNPRIFTCNPGYDCIFNKTGQFTVNKGLSNSSLYAQNANNLYVYCNGQGADEIKSNCDIDFYCPDGGNCYFYTEYGIFNNYANYPKAKIYGQNANLVYIETETDGSLYLTQIYCPTKKTSSSDNCIVKVKGKANVQGLWTPLRETQFYVTESFNGLTLECDLSGSYISCGDDAIMHCGKSYSNSCIMTYNGTNDFDIAEDWICTNSSSPCQGLTFAPTSDPTSLVNVYFVCLLIY